MHAWTDDLSRDENHKRCIERMQLMHAIAEREDGEALYLQRTSGDEPGLVGFMNQTFKFWFRDQLVYEVRGEAELAKTIIQLTAEISDLFMMFQQRHEASEVVIKHLVTARKVNTSKWLETAAEVANQYVDASSADGM